MNSGAINNAIHIETKYSPEIIEQQMFGPDDDLVRSFGRQVIRLQDDGVRQALGDLGWLDPAKVTTLMEDMKSLPRYAFDEREGEMFQIAKGAFINASDVEAILHRAASLAPPPVPEDSRISLDGPYEPGGYSDAYVHQLTARIRALEDGVWKFLEPNPGCGIEFLRALLEPPPCA